MEDSLEDMAENSTLSNAVIYRRSLPVIVIGSTIIFLTAIVSIVGNFAVVTANILDEALKVQMGNKLITNLAIIDMITGFIVIIPCGLSVVFDEWVFGKTMCHIHVFFNYAGASSSSITLALISIDRFIAVLYPLHYPRWVTTNVMRCMCAYPWFHAFLCGSPPAIMDWTIYAYDEAMCSVRWDGSKMVLDFVTFCFVSAYSIPLIIIFICNTLIITSANKMNKSVVVPTDSSASKSNLPEKRKAKGSIDKTVKSIIIVSAFYVMCFTPYSGIKQAKTVIGTISHVSIAEFITTIIMFFSSAANPFFYAILRKDYRNAFRKLPRLLKNSMLSL